MEMKFYHASCNKYMAMGKDQILLRKNMHDVKGQNGPLNYQCCLFYNMEYDHVPFVISVINVADLQHLRNDSMYDFDTQKWTT